MANDIYTQKLRKLYNQIGAMLNEEVAKSPTEQGAWTDTNTLAADAKGKLDAGMEKVRASLSQLVAKIMKPLVMPVLKGVASGLDIKNVITDETKMERWNDVKVAIQKLGEAVKNVSLNFKGANAESYQKLIKALDGMEANYAQLKPEDLKSDAQIEYGILKKSYIVMGILLVVVSAILVAAAGYAMNIIDEVKTIASKFDVRQLAKVFLKLAGLGILIVPAFVGICMIVVAYKGFEDKDTMAARVVAFFYPIISASHYLIGIIIQRAKMAAEAAKKAAPLTPTQQPTHVAKFNLNWLKE